MSIMTYIFNLRKYLQWLTLYDILFDLPKFNDLHLNVSHYWESLNCKIGVVCEVLSELPIWGLDFQKSLIEFSLENKYCGNKYCKNSTYIDLRVVPP